MGNSTATCCFLWSRT